MNSYYLIKFYDFTKNYHCIRLHDFLKTYSFIKIYNFANWVRSSKRDPTGSLNFPLYNL